MYLLKWTSDLDFNNLERLCNSDLSGLKLSVNIANSSSKLLCTVREVY